MKSSSAIVAAGGAHRRLLHEAVALVDRVDELRVGLEQLSRVHHDLEHVEVVRILVAAPGQRRKLNRMVHEEARLDQARPHRAL
ncbi:hypothetical protein [Paractinoplanes hotanensis]|uniref:Uncharacterized protein n=1 Tax=Paractinoplanes hotanensis TaxID=2906497 RepID=A0ABT0YDG0_9ACTN|nr:hypothetical protein [Actinoplanes hotanensis]MCM4083538.1 hypothetical protein [Actinoplanes hotanensis]